MVEQRSAIFPNIVIYANRHVYIGTDTAHPWLIKCRKMETLFLRSSLVNVGHLLWNLSRDTVGDFSFESSEKMKCVTVRSRPLYAV